MHGLKVELVIGLDRNKPHVLAINSLGDRLRIQEVVLVRLHKRLHELGWDQLHVVALRSQNPAKKVSSRTCLHPDQGGLQVCCERDQMLLSELLPQQQLASAQSYKVKRRLAEFDTNRMNLHEAIHGLLDGMYAMAPYATISQSHAHRSNRLRTHTNFASNPQASKSDAANALNYASISFEDVVGYRLDVTPRKGITSPA
jgi:hypothetical protein